MASARSTAITDRKPTVVCPNDGHNQCRDDSDWTQGWIMFRDGDGNHRRTTPMTYCAWRRLPAMRTVPRSMNIS